MRFIAFIRVCKKLFFTFNSRRLHQRQVAAPKTRTSFLWGAFSFAPAFVAGIFFVSTTHIQKAINGLCKPFAAFLFLPKSSFDHNVPKNRRAWGFVFHKS